MNLADATALFSQLRDLEAIAQSSDARWKALQKWLKENPKWDSQVKHWLGLEPDKAFVSLKNYVAYEADIPPEVVEMFAGQIENRVIKTIEALQTLYKERKANA
jgi:hypothetical protein